MASLFTEWIGRWDHLSRADGRLGHRLVMLSTLCLKLHFLVLAESNLSLVIDNLLVSCVGLSRFGKVVSIICIKFVKELAHDVLGLGLVNLLALLFAVRRQRHLALAGLQATDWEHEAMNRLLIFLHIE